MALTLMFASLKFAHFVQHKLLALIPLNGKHKQLAAIVGAPKMDTDRAKYVRASREIGMCEICFVCVCVCARIIALCISGSAIVSHRRPFADSLLQWSSSSGACPN